MTPRLAVPGLRVILDALDVLISQLTALSILAAAIVLVHKREIFHPGYRGAVLFILGGAFLLELLGQLAFFQFVEERTEWRLKHEGILTTARILSSWKAGSYSRRYRGHLNWDHFYDATVLYADQNGAEHRGSVEIGPSQPHASGDTVSVRYLASGPVVMREEVYVSTAKEPPSKLAFASLFWGWDALVFAWIFVRARKKKRRALRIGRTDFPY